MEDSPVARRVVERRAHLRIPIVLAVLCEPIRGKPFGGALMGIGLGGARVDASRTPALGTTLTIAVRLPGSPDLSKLPAIVRWTSGSVFGVQFGVLVTRDTRCIAELMAKALRA